MERACGRLPTLQAIDIRLMAPRVDKLSIPSWLVPAGDRYLPLVADSPGPQFQASPTEKVSLKAILRDFRYDQKRIWTFPEAAARGEHWKPVLGIIAVTSALVVTDPHDTPYFRRTQSFHGFNEAFSSTNTGLEEVLIPPVLYLAGMARKRPYTRRTAVLAGEALADAQILAEVMKNISRRERPREIPPNGDFTHTWFNAGSGILINRGSFPSGHATGAFALATVIAERYRRRRWVPWVAYGIAGVVSFSRITLSAHFPSDIFAGAAFGYSISHFVVMGRP